MDKKDTIFAVNVIHIEYEDSILFVGEEKYTITPSGDLINSRGEICKIATFENPIQISSQSKIISGSNAFQQTISTYPAIQYFSKSFGLGLPDVPVTYMVFAHILTGVTKFIYSHAKLGEHANYGLLASSIIPTVQYVASTMVTTVFKDLKQTMELCAIHGALQITVNDLAKTAYLYSMGDAPILQSSAPSILYGSLHIVASFGESEIQSTHAKVESFYSAGAAFVVGATVMTYNLAPIAGMQALSAIYQLGGASSMITNLVNFQNYAALLKGITAAAVTHRIVKVLFADYDNNIPTDSLKSINGSDNHYEPSVELIGDSYNHKKLEINSTFNIDISVTPNISLKDLFFKYELCTLVDHY